MRKEGQMKISFGMIFSIILIIAFLAFAFYAIKNFLNLSDSAKIGQFIDKLQGDVNDAWRASQASQPVTYNLPDSIGEICFVDEEANGENMFLRRKDSTSRSYPVLIEHIDILEILRGRTENCFDVVNGRLELVIEKEFGDSLVLIDKAST